MDDLLGDSTLPEGNNFDNGFEKLDPFSPESQAHMMSDHGDADELVSSTSNRSMNPHDMPEEDLYKNEPPFDGQSAPSEAEPLIDVSPMVAPSEPEPLIPDIVPAPVPDPEPVVVSSSFYQPESNCEPYAEPGAPAPPEADQDSTPSPAPSPVKKSPCSTVSPGKEDTQPASVGGNIAETLEGWLQGMDPRVVELVYWRDVKKTGLVFGSILVVLFSLALFSVLSVIAYLSLAALTVTVSFRVYKNVLGAIQKTGEGHPFKDYLGVDIALPEEKVHELANMVMCHVSCALRELRRVFLVEDMIDSIKFGLVLWVLTYVGSWFNGMTLIILGVVAIFSLPKVYETYKVQIDQYIDLAKTQIRNVVKQVQEKIPLPGKKKTA